METHSSSNLKNTVQPSAKTPAPALPTSPAATSIPQSGTSALPVAGFEPRSAGPIDTNLPRIVPFDDPFVGFGGRAFLHFCQLVEVCSAWIRPHPTGGSAAVESLMASARLKQWGACSLGTMCCTVIAAGLIPLFSGSSIKSFLPLPFLLIIVLVALRFGRIAGVLGTLASAFLFAYYLFEPAGLAVSDPVARAHLIWMLVVGIVISDLLMRFKAHRMHSHTP